MAPWMQSAMGMAQLGQMGRGPQMQSPQLQRRPMQQTGPIGGFMPQQQQPMMTGTQGQLTPAMINQLLAQKSGLMGGGSGGQF
jgi:hypothetical protein